MLQSFQYELFPWPVSIGRVAVEPAFNHQLAQNRHETHEVEISPCHPPGVDFAESGGVLLFESIQPRTFIDDPNASSSLGMGFLSHASVPQKRRWTRNLRVPEKSADT